MDGHSASCWLAIAGTICYAAVIEIGLSTSVPINQVITDWSFQSPPDNWKDVRAEWIQWHILRTLVSIPTLLCYLLSYLLADDRFYQRKLESSSTDRLGVNKTICRGELRIGLL